MNSIDRDGFALSYVREGQGTPMLVLGAPRFYERCFPKALRDHFDMVFCDLRQWVPTPDGYDIASITLETFTDDIDAIIDEVGLDRPVVMGQSQHGALALEYARTHPARTRGVVAVCPNAPVSGLTGRPTADEFFEQDASPERQSAHQRNVATRPYLDDPTTSQEAIAEYLALAALIWYDCDFDSSPLWVGSEMNLDVMDQLFADTNLPSYDVNNQHTPTLLALGRYDYFVPFVHWDEPSTRLAPLTTRMYDRSGHYPPYEEPEKFTADVITWAAAL